MRKLLEALKELLAGIVNMVAWPSRVMTRLFGLDRGRGEDEPERAAGKAVTAAQKEAAEEDRNAVLRRQARALQRVLDARHAGQEPPKAALAQLPEQVRSYVMSLTQDEVAVAVRGTSSGVMMAVVGEGLSGVRTPAEVRHAAAAARRAALEVVEGGPKPAAAPAPGKTTTRSVDDIMAELTAPAPRRMGM